MARSFFFPLHALYPAGDWNEIQTVDCAIVRRKWETSIFDLYTLASRHSLSIPAELMHVMLQRCNLEVRINAETVEHAASKLNTLLLSLYSEGVSPTFAPFATTYSINEYSGINSRDSNILREQLPPELREGITSKDHKVEAWPVQLTFHCHSIPSAQKVTEQIFHGAVEKASTWRELERNTPVLKVVRDAAQNAPLLSSRDQSLLHLWCALEAIFPKVQSEVVFRLSLYLAQLCLKDRQATFESAKAAYNTRSKIAHGSKREISFEEWHATWSLLMTAVNAILARRALPSEDALHAEIFASAACAD